MNKNVLKEKKLRIAIVQQSPDMGGAENYMLLLISHFLQNGHQVSLVTNRGKFFDEGKKKHIRIYEIPIILDFMGNIRGLIKSTLFLPFAVVFYIKLLVQFRKNNVDVILMSNFSEKLLVTLLSPLVAIPVVWIEYGRLETVFKRNFRIPEFFYKSVKGIPKAVIVPTENTRESLSQSAKVREDKIRLIPCGISFATTKKMVDYSDWKDKIIIGNASRLTREKGQEYLIRSIPHIIKKVPRTRFLIIGDGPDKEYYQNLIRTLAIEEYVRVEGFVDRIEEYYAAMDIFIFPTVWELEGFGLVMVEAMRQQLPVIGSNIPPVDEIIDDTSTGMLVMPKNEKAIANAVIKLARDKSLRTRMGKAGYKKAINKYDIQKVTLQVLDVLMNASIS